MRSGGWSARLALLKVFDAACEAVSEEEEAELHVLVRSLGQKETEAWLRSVRAQAMALLSLTKAQRTKRLAALDPEDRLWLRYAVAAWSAKAVVYFELLEKSSIAPVDLQKWSGPAGLNLVAEYEGNQVWLWPWGGLTPWYEEVVVEVEAFDE